MGVLDRLFPMDRVVLEARVRDLETRVSQLYMENQSLKDQLPGEDTQVRNLEQGGRITNLASALEKLIKLVEREYCGSDDQAVIRSCRAVLEKNR